MKRLTLALALGLAVAACSAESADQTTDFAAEESGAPVEGQVTIATDGGVDEDRAGFDINFEVAQDRKVIRQASLRLQADDTRAAFDRIVELAEGAGGFVANATVHPVEGEDDQPEVAMTLRIPAAELTETMAAIKDSVEEVVSESQGAQDVTEQYIDLEARLTNLEALEVELRALLTEVRQQPNADPDELLRVFTEISNVRGEIEQIEGQLNYLDDAVALATLEIGLTPTPAAIPIVEDEWQPVEVAREAVRDLVAGMQQVADWAISFALYTLPMLILVLGPPLLVGFFVYRQWRKRRHPVMPTPSES